jgi:hypothetical protein
VGKALERATDNALVEALGDFVSTILDNLPFGLGDRFRDVLEGIVALVTSVDDLVEGINTHILEPLRVNWFSAEEGEGVSGTFVEPLIEHVFDPLEAHLVNLAVLADNWQDKLVSPAEKALAERSQVREEIARYKEKHGFL